MLKTLNDICYSEYLTKKMIKQEAIKWVKDKSEDVSDWKENFKAFHNITEEDLKEVEDD